MKMYGNVSMTGAYTNSYRNIGFPKWLTLTGIKFPNGPWLSGMEISSSPGLEIPLKLVHGQKLSPPKGCRPAGGKAFLPKG